MSGQLQILIKRPNQVGFNTHPLWRAKGSFQLTYGQYGSPLPLPQSIKTLKTSRSQIAHFMMVLYRSCVNDLEMKWPNWNHVFETNFSDAIGRKSLKFLPNVQLKDPQIASGLSNQSVPGNKTQTWDPSGETPSGETRNRSIGTTSKRPKPWTHVLTTYALMGSNGG